MDNERQVFERIARAMHAHITDWLSTPWDGLTDRAKDNRICDAQRFAIAAEAFGLTASDLAGLAEGKAVVVPVEPTLEMLQAGHFEHRTLVMSGTSGMTMRSQMRSECAREYACYRAMLAARPAAKEPNHD